MNRRGFLKHLGTLSVGAAIRGYLRQSQKVNKFDGTKYEDPSRQSNITTLKIVLQGAFAVVVHKSGLFPDENKNYTQKNTGYRVKAYVPYDPNHEFRFQSPLVIKKDHKNYQFHLSFDGCPEIGSDEPYIDHGFDDFNVELSTWKLRQVPFVLLDLPAPRAITYFPPREPVLFESPGTYGVLPLNHILEYRVKEGCKIKMLSQQLGNCIPLSCEDLHDQYTKEWKVEEERHLKEEHTDSEQRSYIKGALKRCSQSTVGAYFFGVGLPPDWKGIRKEHALNFFNTRLLPSIYGTEIPPERKLKEIGVSPCDAGRTISSSPVLMPAVWQQRVPQPRWLPIASTDNCTAPGVTATVK